MALTVADLPPLSAEEIVKLTERQEKWFNRLFTAIGDHDQTAEKLASAHIRFIKAHLDIDVQLKTIEAAQRRLDESLEVASEAWAIMESVWIQDPLRGP